MILLWAIVLGLVGFLCGFIGPIILAPEANQGPLLGIFITGPVGAVLGAFLGVAIRIFGMSARANRVALIAASIILACGTFYYCIPRPRLLAGIVDVQILSCVATATLKENTAVRLIATEASRPDPKSTSWGSKFDRALANRSGMVINVRVLQAKQIFEKRAVWNRGDLVASPWASADRSGSYFLPGLSGCEGHPGGSSTMLAVSGNTQVWPPYGIAEMLGVQVAEPVPVKYSALVN